MTQQQIRKLNMIVLQSVIGRKHAIAEANFCNTITWQVMPDELIDYDFFNWYCYVRPYMQFFENCHEATTMYLFYRNMWIDKGCPDWKDAKESEIDNTKPHWYTEEKEEDEDE